MSSLVRLQVGLLILFSFCRLGPAQTATSTAPSAPTPPATAESKPSVPAAVFHAETRLVILDLVVTDKQGQAVPDLKKSDIELLEDGKPQQLQVFELHTPPSQPKVVPKIDLPPNQYTNFPIQPPSNSVNIVLFDTMNTPVTDQMYARRQMVEFLKALPPGKQVALFTLGQQLRMISGFTTDSESLVAAATKVLPKVSPVDEENPIGDTPNGPATPASSTVGSSGPSGVTDLIGDFLFRQEAFRLGNRVQSTLNAFDGIARAVSGYPGRKNLLWLSEGFPITFAPDILSASSIGNVQRYSSELQRSSALLSSSQISLYPIDVRGVSGRRAYAMYDTMDDLAKQTGGKAFYGTNDLKLAMKQSIERGSTYYVAAYVPDNHNWDSRYRHIKIKFARSGLSADYRVGYYAIPDQQSPADEARLRLIAAMQPGLPESTMLLLRVQVLPPDSKNKMVRVDFGVYAPDIAFTEASNHSTYAKLEFVAVAWDKNNVAAGNASQTMDLALKPETYKTILQNGITAHLELALTPGTYGLRLGVMDDGNNKIGTLNVPLRIAEAPEAATK